MSDMTIENLQIEIETSSKTAASGIDALTASLNRLKSALKGISFNPLSKQLNSLNATLGSVDSANISKLDRIAVSLRSLSALGSVKISPTIAKQLKEMVDALNSLEDDVDLDGVKRVVDALTGLNGIRVSKDLGDSLTKITEALNKISKVDPIDPQLVTNLNILGVALRGFAGISNVDFGGIAKLITALNGLGSIKPIPNTIFSNMNKMAAAIRRFNDALADISTSRLNALARIITALNPPIHTTTKSLTSFSYAMSTVSKVTTTFWNGIKKTISIMAKLSSTSNTSIKSFARINEGITKTIAKLGILIYALKRATDLISDWVLKSSQYTEDINLFTVSMGKYADAAYEYAQQVGEIMGIDPGEWMRNQGLFMNLATGFGVVSDRAEIMSRNLTQLGYDISSFFNLGFEDSMAKLQSGLAGELEPLRRIGFDLSVARLQQEAYRLGIDKTVQSMTQAEKAELRYYAIMTQVTAVQGDMARTLDAPANQLRVLQAQVAMAGRALGNIFIPALNAILPYAIAAAKVVRLLADNIARLFGFEFPEVDYSSMGIAVSGVSDGVEDIGSGLDDATSKAKELKKNLMGLDELNVLTTTEDDKGIDLSSSNGLGFELPEYDFLGDAAQSRVDELVNSWLAALDNFNWGVVREKARELGTKTADVLSEVFGNRSIFYTAGEALGQGLNTVFDYFDAFADEMNADNTWHKIGSSLALGLNTAIEFFEPILAGQAIYKNLNGIVDIIYTFFSETDWEYIGRKVAVGLNTIFDGIDWNQLGAMFGSQLNALILSAKGFVDQLDWSEIGLAISDAVMGFFTEVNWADAGIAISTGVKGVLDAIGIALAETDWTQIGEDIRTFLVNIDWVGIIGSVGGVILEAMGSLDELLTAIFGEPMAIVIKTVAYAIGAVTGAMWLLNAAFAAKGLADKIKGLFGGASAKTVSTVSGSVGTLTTKLVTLAKNLGLGLVIIAEVAAAALLIGGAIWLLGRELEQVGLAWEPVIANGDTIAVAMGLGATILGAVGIVTAALGSKGSALVVNMALGIAVLAEIGVAAALFIAEIWAIGWGLEQIGIAWEPVLANGETIADAIGWGTLILVAVGAATALLGVAAVGTAGLLPAAIALGTVILLEMGVAVGLFVAEIWAIGKGLEEIGLSWEPVLNDGENIARAIEKGTDLLVAVGATTALLGGATIATGGLLWVAVDLGTAMLVKLGDSAIKFTESLTAVADEMSNNLAPALTRLNEKLPNLSTNMSNFVTFMTEFAGYVVTYSEASAISGLAGTIGTIIGWFTDDPLQTLADDVNEIYTQAQALNEKLGLAVPELGTATALLKSYTTFIEEIETLTGSSDNSSLSSGVFVDMSEVGVNLVTGFVSGIESESTNFINAGLTLITGFTSGLLSASEQSKISVTTWAGNIKIWFISKASYAVFNQIGVDVVRGFNNGLNSASRSSAIAVRNWTKTITGTMTGLLDINSPSKLFGEYGADTVDGYNIEISKQAGSTSKVIDQWVNSFAGVNPNMVMSVDTSALKYYDSGSFSKSISSSVSASVENEGFEAEFRGSLYEVLYPVLNDIRTNTRDIAEKESDSGISTNHQFNNMQKAAVEYRKRTNTPAFV